MGICGGYQLMGLEIHDPEGVEGEIRQLPGLGLLPVITTMQGEKVTRQVNFHFLENAETCQGYERHMGETRPGPVELSLIHIEMCIRDSPLFIMYWAPMP